MGSSGTAGLRSATACALSAVVCAMLGCGRPAPPTNLVLISIDSLRADHLGCYGYARPTSPSIDELARDGILFRRAYSTSSWTLPAHLSLLASLYPEEHGVVDGTRALGPEAQLLPEVLSAAGYRSVGVVSGPYLESGWGYDQGWEEYDDRLALPSDRVGKNASHGVINSPEVHAAVLEKLDRLGAGPFFLFVHYWDVHYDYLPPPPYDALFDPDYSGTVTGREFESNPAIGPDMAPRDLEHVVALYDGEIRWVDSWIGELVAELRRRGLLDRTAIVLTSDHGDEFFEHGQKGHQKNLFEPVLRVPLIVRPPEGGARGVRSDALASLVDVAPTLAALSGLQPPAAWSGRSLVDRDGGVVVEEGLATVFADLFGRRKALLRGPWKLLAGPGGADSRLRVRALFDLEEDPAELGNRKRARPEIADSLFVALMDAQRRFATRAASHPSRPHRADAELEEALRALGYL